MSGETNFGIRVTWDGSAAKEGAQQVVEDLNKVRTAGTEVVKQTDNMGMSAKQYAWAMRDVPAQVTDIVTGLWDGQTPMTVLIQQGGQLKDMFGGVAPAAQALGTYVKGLVTPMTVGAAAAGLLGFALVKAYSEGASESEQMRRAIIMTGDAIGASYSEMVAQSQRAADSSGQTRAAAASVLTALVSSGRIAVGELGNVTDSILRLDDTGAQSIKESVKQFTELGKSPVEASIRLNEQYHYLTQSTYSQIKALQDQAREEDAAALAQRTYAQAMSERAAKIEADLGNVERAWKNAGQAAKSAWDWFLGIGRDDSVLEKLTAAKEKLAALKADGTPSTDSDYKEAELSVRVLQTAYESQQKLSASKAESARQDQAGIQWSQQGVQVADNRTKREQEIAKARQLGLEAGKSDYEIQQRIAQINQKYKDPAVQKTDQQKDSDLIAQYQRENEYALEKIARTSELASMSERERTILEAQYKAEDDAQRMRERIISTVKSEAEQKRGLLAIDEKLAGQKDRIADYTAAAFDDSRTFQYGWNKAMQQFADDSTNYAKMAQQGVTTFVDSTSNALANWSTSGKLNVASLFTSLMAYMIKVQMMAAASSVLSSIFGGTAVTGTGYTSASPTSAGTYNYAGSQMTINALPSAHGNVFSEAPSLAQYTNSLLTGPTLFQYGKLHAFANGGAMSGVGGEKGTEAVMPLTRVGNDLGVKALINVSGQQSGATPKVIFNTYNNVSGAQVESKQSTNANGDIQIDTFILDTVKGGMNKGYFDTTLQTTHNIKRVGK